MQYKVAGFKPPLKKPQFFWFKWIFLDLSYFRLHKRVGIPFSFCKKMEEVGIFCSIVVVCIAFLASRLITWIYFGKCTKEEVAVTLEKKEKEGHGKEDYWTLRDRTEKEEHGMLLGEWIFFCMFSF